MIPSFVNKVENKIIFLYIRRWENLLVKMFLNKQEAHNTEERVVESTSKDTQEEL